MPRYIALNNLRHDFCGYSFRAIGSVDAPDPDTALSHAKQRFHVINPSVLLWDKGPAGSAAEV